MYVPEIHEQRKKISGLKMPRSFSPRLPGPSTKGQAPINPYGANKMKVASVEEFVKSASLYEYSVFMELQKVAQAVETEEEYWQYCADKYGEEMEKDAGINAAMRVAAKALTGSGRALRSTTLTRGGSKMYGRLSNRLQSQAAKVNVAGKQSPAAVQALNQQRNTARIAQQQADKQVKSIERLKAMKAKGIKPGGGSKKMSTGKKLLIGGSTVGLLGTAVGAHKLNQVGKAQNLQSAGRGFNYGIPG